MLCLPAYGETRLKCRRYVFIVRIPHWSRHVFEYDQWVLNGSRDVYKTPPCQQRVQNEKPSSVADIHVWGFTRCE